jgi:hypothetical protein
VDLVYFLHHQKIKQITLDQFHLIYKSQNLARTSYSEFREMSIEKDAEPTLTHKFLTSHFFCSLQRNAVRTEASKDRTVSHNVPLRGGAMQIDASSYCF